MFSFFKRFLKNDKTRKIENIELDINGELEYISTISKDLKNIRELSEDIVSICKELAKHSNDTRYFIIKYLL